MGEMKRARLAFLALLLCGSFAALEVEALPAASAAGRAGRAPRVSAQTGRQPEAARAFLTTYCTGCHNQERKTAGLILDAANVDRVAQNADVWEKVIRKLRGGLMP